MTILSAGLFPHSPYRSNSFCLHRPHGLKLNFFWARDQISAIGRNNPELLPTPSTARTTDVNGDLKLWSHAIPNFSRNIGLRFLTHQPRVIYVPMPPLPQFQKYASHCPQMGHTCETRKAPMFHRRTFQRSVEPVVPEALLWSEGSSNEIDRRRR